MSNCEFYELTLATLISSKYISDFVIYKYTISMNFEILLYLQMYFWGGHTTRMHGSIPREGEWDTGVGRSSYIEPNSRILIHNPLAGKAAQKKLTKSQFGEFPSMENALNYF
jgi:hypothetical protein